MNCIVCDSPSHTCRPPFFKCSSCGLEFCDPMPDPVSLKEFYKDYKDVLTSDVEVKWRLEFFRSVFPRGHGYSLLDYGCGYNEFVFHSREKFWVGFDPWVEKFSSVKPLSLKYDCATMWGVLEHVVDPQETVNTVLNCLRSGGSLFLTTVGRDLPIPFRYKYPEHLTYWTEASLRDLFSGHQVSVRHHYKKLYSRDYIRIILRTVPFEYRSCFQVDLPDAVYVPTNEYFVEVVKK